MAAPDRVYRYYTNLKTKDSNGNVLNIRTAKPLLSYTDVNTFKDKFKLSGVLKVDNPIIPSSDDSYDAGDSNRNGIIGFVKADNSDGMAAYHDIRTGNFGSDSASKDYSTRTKSRVALARTLDGVECFVFNDAGLNRRGGFALTSLKFYTRWYNYVRVGVTFEAPIYNQITQSILKLQKSGIDIENASFDFGIIRQNSSLEAEFILTENSTVNYGNTLNLISQAINEEGTYSENTSGIMTYPIQYPIPRWIKYENSNYTNSGNLYMYLGGSTWTELNSPKGYADLGSVGTLETTTNIICYTDDTLTTLLPAEEFNEGKRFSKDFSPVEKELSRGVGEVHFTTGTNMRNEWSRIRIQHKEAGSMFNKKLGVFTIETSASYWSATPDISGVIVEKRDNTLIVTQDTYTSELITITISAEGLPSVIVEVETN